MTRRFPGDAALAALILLMVCVGRAGAQTSAPGPYYATPSWDQKLRCDTQATCPRFVVLSNWNNEAVLDRETGLVWERNPLHPQPNVIDSDPGFRTWNSAPGYCATKEVGGRYGWRLPTLQELTTLLDGSGQPPSLPAGHPFTNVQATVYWTATTQLQEPFWAWAIGFHAQPPNTFTFFPHPKSVAVSVWCVRGGESHDAQ